MDLDVPAQIVHPLRQRLEHVRCRGTGLDQVEPDSSYTGCAEALELRIRNARVDYCDCTCSGPELLYSIEGAPVVRSVTGGLYDHGPSRSQALLQQSIILHV